MDRQDAFANIALDRVLAKARAQEVDRHLATELVYGIVRHQRTLDSLIEQFGRRSASQQPPALRRILQIGFYQLRYLDRIPASAAVNTTVELAHRCQLGRLSKVANGILRTYLRTPKDKVLPRHDNPVTDLALRYSYPDWLVELWIDRLGGEEAETLCAWFNRPPAIDLRVNRLQTSVDRVRAALQSVSVEAQPLGDIPGSLRLNGHVGAIANLPGFAEGHWSVQDASAQQVAQLLNPKPGEIVIDCCAAPGGKTTHIAELMGDRGTVWALDRHAGRLERVNVNARRLQLNCIQTRAVDLAAESPLPDELPQAGSCDRVLVDAPCSGLGTLHRHADARWRQKPEKIAELTQLQAKILDRAATWVKPNGAMVYSTCTTHPEENRQQVERFLSHHPDWRIDPAVEPQQIWPHRSDRDGFYMARLCKQ